MPREHVVDEGGVRRAVERVEGDEDRVGRLRDRGARGQDGRERTVAAEPLEQ